MEISRKKIFWLLILIIVAAFMFINFRGVSFSSSGSVRYIWDGEHLTLSADSPSISIRQNEGNVLTITHGNDSEIIEAGTRSLSIRRGETLMVGLPSSISELSVSTTTGDISLFPLKAGTISLGSSSGDISLTSAEADTLSLVALTGRIFIGDIAVSGEFSVQNESGNIEFNEASAGSIRITTESGEISGYIAASENTQISSHEGNIRLQVEKPEEYSSDISTLTGMTDIAEGYTGGSIPLAISSTSGNITLL